MAAGGMGEYLQVAPNKLMLRFEIGKPASASISLQVGPGDQWRRLESGRARAGPSCARHFESKSR